MTACDVIPTSAYTALLQSAADTDYHLRLERLCLDRCNLNDQALYHIAISQVSFLDFTICLSDGRVTDIGMKDVLSRCHRLTPLNILVKLTITTAFMVNEDEDNTTNTRSPIEAEQKRWACYKTLKRLDIREEVIVDLGRFFTRRMIRELKGEKERRFGGFDDELGYCQSWRI